jgi:S-layer homology domain
MFVENRMIRGRKWKVSAAALMLAAAALRADDERRPTNQEQLKQFHESWVAAGRPAPASVQPKWGTNSLEVLNVHAYTFQANTSSNLIMDDGNGYRFFGDEAVPYMAAPVVLPAGVKIGAMQISHCSANAGDIVVALYDNGEGGSGGGGGTIVAGPIATPAGCGVYGEFAPGNTYAGTLGHPLYLVVYFAGGQTDGSARFNNVSVWYQRQVSPAPAQASFCDVPTSDFGFQYIEALAASGITGGCGQGNYCPDQPVNRRQMAIFLAKALGLHWSDFGGGADD